MTKVAIFTEFGEWSASTRYRVLQYLPRLRETFDTVVVYLPDDRPARRPGRLGQARYFGSHGLRYVRRWSEVSRHACEYDRIVVQRGLYPLGPAQLTRPLLGFRGRLVLDLDDDVFAVKPALASKGAVARWLYGPQQTHALVDRADHVIASTDVLAEKILQRRADVTVLPTVPDPGRYVVSDQRAVAPALVWAGTVGGLPYLDPLREVFQQLKDGGVGELTVISSQPWHGPARFQLWRAEHEHSSLARFAIGIMPMPDTAFTRAKAGFKLLQYMAAGIPVIASPVGGNVELVRRSGGGILARGIVEWRDAVETLLASPDLRSELGANGLQFVRSYADVDRRARELGEVVAA